MIHTLLTCLLSELTAEPSFMVCRLVCDAGGPPSLRLLPSAPLRPEDDVALKWLLLKLTMADISAKIRQGARPPATAPTRGEQHGNRYI